MLHSHDLTGDPNHSDGTDRDADALATVTDEMIEGIRTRDLHAVTAAWMEIEVTLIEPERDLSLAAISAAGFEGNHAEPLTLAIGHIDDRDFWLGFFHDLRARGLRDIDVIVSHEYRGLTDAVAAIFPAAGVVSWKSLAALACPSPGQGGGRARR